VTDPLDFKFLRKPLVSLPQSSFVLALIRTSATLEAQDNFPFWRLLL
jgi:hypothetical protein